VGIAPRLIRKFASKLDPPDSGSRPAPLPLLPASQPDFGRAPGFPTVLIVLRIVLIVLRIVLIVLRIVFFIASHCSCAGSFSFAPVMTYIVIGVAFSIVNRLYFWEKFCGTAGGVQELCAPHRGYAAESVASPGTSALIGFVRRESESGCIEFDSETSDRIDGRWTAPLWVRRNEGIRAACPIAYSRYLPGGKSRENTGCCTNALGS
jgi:hypothetical protein